MFHAIVRTMFMFVQLLKKEKLTLNTTESDDIPVLSNQNGDLVVKKERLLILQFCIEGCYKQWLKKIWSHIKHLKCTFDGAFWGGLKLNLSAWLIIRKEHNGPPSHLISALPPIERLRNLRRGEGVFKNL